MGDTVSADVPNAGTVTFVYVTDPEGNIIELQSWQASGDVEQRNSTDQRT